MEPFEWALLGIGLAVGGIFGANSKTIMRSTARAYLAVGEKSREWTSNVREDFHDAVEEARYERDESEYESDHEEDPKEADGNSHTPVRAARKSSPASTRNRRAHTAAAEPASTD